MKALNKDIFREFRKTGSRFFAIFAIVALGAGFFAGLSATSPDMRLTCDTYFDEHGMHDIRLISTAGFTEADLDALRAEPEISTVSPAYFADLVVQNGEVEKVAHLLSLTDGVNTPELKEGRMPTSPDECLLDSAAVEKFGFSLGDTILIPEDNKEETLELISPRELKVVGIVSSPLYVTFDRGTSTIGSGSVDFFLLLPSEAFTSDYYLEVYLTLKDTTSKNTFKEEYQQLIDSAIPHLETLGEERSEIRYQEIRDEADAALADARAELEKNRSDGEQQLADAEEQLADAEEQLRTGRNELQTAERTLAEKEAELEEGRRSFEAMKAETEPQLEAAEAELDQQQQKLDAVGEQLAQLEAQLETLTASYEAAIEAGDEATAAATKALIDQLTPVVEQMRSEYENGTAQIAAGRAELAQSRSKLDAAEATIADGELQLAEGKRALETSRRQLEQGEQDLAEGQKEFEENRRTFEEEISKAEAEISDAESEINELEQPTWMVLDREKNAGFVSLSQDIDRVAAISGVFPVFFFLVAALVCLTTMTRMVEEHRTEIGTFGALGYGKLKIAKKYILYALFAAVFGSILGLFVGFWLFPVVIWNAYGMLYTDLPSIQTPFNFFYAVLATGGAILCTVGTALLSCIGELRETPAQLMRPRPPKNGKRILLEQFTPLWNRMSFSYKVTARNLFRYKKRFLMTVIGISGCTALMLTGFGLKDSISVIVDNQFGDIFHYNLTATAAEGELSQAVESIANEPLITDSMLYYQKLVTAESDQGKTDVYLTIPEHTDGLSTFISLRERQSGQEIPLSDEGVVLTEKLAKLLGLSSGDELTLTLEDQSVSVRVLDVCENYVYHYVYMTPALYEQLTGTAPEFSQIMAVTTEASESVEAEASATLLASGFFTSADFIDSSVKSISDAMGSLDYIVLVLIICAALLSFVVLYNLTNINITERIREIATIKVLGFTSREVSSYVYRENVALTVIGAAAGIPLGLLLHRFVISAAELDMVMFSREIKPLGYLLSIALTLLFSALVNLVMHHKLKKISMTESLKSVE